MLVLLSQRWSVWEPRGLLTQVIMDPTLFQAAQVLPHDFTPELKCGPDTMVLPLLLSLYPPQLLRKVCLTIVFYCAANGMNRAYCY